MNPPAAIPHWGFGLRFRLPLTALRTLCSPGTVNVSGTH